ncbi:MULTISPECIES: IS66 family transposase [unclassified Oceanispirochaeta]|nr:MULTISPECIES: IS66 family transposase [unclassified Oceanispirochaeta]MBF9018980.1 IS66 family transposase [Oceanispirochaeta sp. M2]NPD75480.1 IS66 family transposase [Oceanispirochaeta sp. M1]
MNAIESLSDGKKNRIIREPSELKKLIEELQEQNSTLLTNNITLLTDNNTLQKKNDRLKERVKLLEDHIFARRSEKWTVLDKLQMNLFDEAEAVISEDPSESGESDESDTPKEKLKKRGRKPIPADIPREKVLHSLSIEERTCPCCGKLRPIIGYETSEELEYIPAQIKVKVHEREKCGPCNCGDFEDSEESPIITAKAPPRIMPGSIASASLLAFIITGKYCDSLPFYRHERIFKRLGVDISRTNMCNWTIKTALKCSDLIDLLKERTREGPLINMDETTVQVLKESGKKVDSKSYMWVTVGSDSGNKIVLFNYSRTRKEDMAVKLLEGYAGSLQTDGYAGYNAATRKYNLWHVACLAHIRRKFVEAAKATKSGGQANKAIKYIRKLYVIENELRAMQLTASDFNSLRRNRAIPILKEFRKWLTEKKVTVVPSMALGKAVNYADSEYMKMVRYLKYDYLTPDNNAAENSIRPFVIEKTGFSMILPGERMPVLLCIHWSRQPKLTA